MCSLLDSPYRCYPCQYLWVANYDFRLENRHLRSLTPDGVWFPKTHPSRIIAGSRCGSRKLVGLEIIDDFQIRVKWVSEGQRPVEAALQVDLG